MNGWIILEDHYSRETKIGSGNHFIIREDIYPDYSDGTGSYYIDLYDLDSQRPPETVYTKDLTAKQVWDLLNE